ncbi:MAG TPA: MBL fold metallo-hydrolase, partial [Bacteroidota bacterium]|nr:MBL fold metallo-hydrolase [Bacteroidota bacterium]
KALRALLTCPTGSIGTISSNKSKEVMDDFPIIPTFGHTKGHCALLYRNHFLFTGDHLWWSRAKGALNASEDVCWYSWPQQIASVRTLMQFTFSWVLPGHGERIKLPPLTIHEELKTLVDRM